MYTRVILLSIVAIMVTGCGDPEEKARALQNRAITLMSDKQGIEAIEVYESIVKKYPTTLAAVESNKQLATLKPLISSMVVSCVNQAAEVKLSIAEYYQTTNEIPKNDDVNRYLSDAKSEFCSASADNGDVVVTFFGKEPLFDGTTIILEAEFLEGRIVKWSCLGGTFSQKYRPAQCKSS